MSRYADMVQTGLSVGREGNAIQLSRISLALPQWFLDVFPTSIRSIAHHAWIWLGSLFRVGSKRYDLFHILDGSHAYFVRGIRNKPIVVTSHDIIPLKQLRGDFEAGKPGILAGKLILAAVDGMKSSTRIVAVSHSTCRDLVEEAAVSREQITVVHNALDHGVVCKNDSDSGDASNSGRPFIFHIGNEGFYKNRAGVLRIFSTLAERFDGRLVMAGPAPSRDTKALVRRLNLEDRVEFVTDPDESKISECYRAASLFLFPSIYEGFGWPPLEAMANGCPVVCSDAGSLPEIVGDAALLAHAEDEALLAEHCLSVLGNPDLARSLVQKGRERAGRFSLEKMIGELTAVYRVALAGHLRAIEASEEAP